MGWYAKDDVVTPHSAPHEIPVDPAALEPEQAIEYSPSW